MRTVTIKRCSQEMRRLLKSAKKEDVVLRTAEGREVLLSQIGDFDYEIAAQRANKELMAYLDRLGRRSRREKGIPLEEVCRQLGLPPLSTNGPPPPSERTKTINISRCSEGIAKLLCQACSEDLLLKIADGSEYVLTTIHNGDREAAKTHSGDIVMAYLDKLAAKGKIPPIEVVFAQNLRGPKTAPDTRRSARAKTRS